MCANVPVAYGGRANIGSLGATVACRWHNVTAVPVAQQSLL